MDVMIQTEEMYARLAKKISMRGIERGPVCAQRLRQSLSNEIMDLLDEEQITIQCLARKIGQSEDWTRRAARGELDLSIDQVEKILVALGCSLGLKKAPANTL